jgi:hypothetical protein
MKTYNRALDFMALAMDQHAKGRTKTAASLFVKASQSPDLAQAIAIIEASNAQAYTAKVKAEATKKVVKASSKTIAEKKQIASLVGDVDDAEFCDDGEEVEAEAEPQGEPEVVEDEETEPGVDDADAFASALASLKKPAPKKK